jgi:hypothetical protein
MSTIKDLRKAITDGLTSEVGYIARELHDNGVDIMPMYKHACTLNKARKGAWQDIVDVLEEIIIS